MFNLTTPAISLDNTAVSTDQTAGPVTWNHTCSGSNNVLFVGLASIAQSNLNTVTAVTYGGVSMTKVRTDSIVSNTASEIEVTIWKLAAPLSGSNQVSATITGSGTSPHYGGGSASYKEAAQTNTAAAANGTTGTTAADQTFTVTTTVDGSWIFSFGVAASATSTTLTADKTSRGTTSLAFLFPAVTRMQDTNALITPAGNSTVGMTTGGVSFQDFAISAASIEPFVNQNTYPRVIRPHPFSPGLAR